MILIADGGSTKCDWTALNMNGDLIFESSTQGLNPAILSTQKIRQRISKNDSLAHIKDKVERVYFFGAGCGTLTSKTKMSRFLKNYFVGSTCKIHGDLYAACLAVTDKPGIVCITGTGSNSCYFDGHKNMEPNAPALGYTLMDEASGNYFGKLLLNDFFYNRMPKALAEQFRQEYNLDPSYIRKRLYQDENPNVYLAAFTPFLFKEIPFPEYQKNLLKMGFKLFIENRVLPYTNSSNLPVHFVGSVAYFAKPIISSLLEEYDLIEGKIIQKPIEALVSRIKKEL